MHKKLITVRYACLDCRKVFKKTKYIQDRQGNWEPIEDYKVVCPQCNSDMYETGPAFKAPKTDDEKAWLKLRTLFESGYRFFNDRGNPFEEKSVTKTENPKEPNSVFRKPSRKR